MIFLKPKNIYHVFIQKIINLFFRLWRSISKKFLSRKSNHNYINGNFFKDLSNKKSNLIYHELDKRLPTKKKIEIFKNKVWIFHNSDTSFDYKKKKQLNKFSPKYCFSQNLIIKDKRFNFLPIGLENEEHYNHGNIKEFKILRKKKIYKIPQILYGFKMTNKSRLKIKKIFDNCKLCVETSGWNSYFYRRIMMKYMFAICPEGNGFDTHRFWECLYLKTIPIVKKNSFNIHFLKTELPVFFLNNWSEVKNLKLDQLINFYRTKKNKFNNKILFKNYWKKLIFKITDK